MADIRAELRSKTKVHASIRQATGAAGAKQHSQLSGRDVPDQHPMSAITGLVSALAKKSDGLEITAEGLVYLTSDGERVAGPYELFSPGDGEHSGPAYVASDEPPEDTDVLWVNTSEPEEAIALGVTAVETAEGVDMYCTDELGTKKVSLRHGKDGAPGAKGPAYVASDEPPEDTDVLWVNTSEPEEAIALGVTAEETAEGVDIYATDELGTKKVSLRHGKDGAPGADYELTDEDLQVIAGIAAGLVPGGGEVWETIIDYTVPEDCVAVILTTDVDGKEFKLKKASAVFVLHPIEGAEELPANVQMGYSFLSEDTTPYNSVIYRWGYADVPRAAGKVSVAAFLLVDTGSGVKIADYRQSGVVAYAANSNAGLKITTSAQESINMDTLEYKLREITACSVGSFTKCIGAGTRIKMMGVRA